MTRNRPLHTISFVLAVATVSLVHEPGSAKPPSPSSGTARFDDTTGNTILSDSNLPYVGAFASDGNFSFNTGTQRQINFVFGAWKDLLGGQTAPPQATAPDNRTPKANVTFSVLTPTSGGSLLTIQPGSPEVRSVRFVWPNDDGTGIVSDYGLHFRGNALLDDDGDGVPYEAFPDDGTEMSKVLTTCVSLGLGGCVEWRMTPCAGDCSDPNANPDGSTVPIGQLYGTFPRKTGNRPIARFEMQWALAICRTTTDHPCPSN